MSKVDKSEIPNHSALHTSDLVVIFRPISFYFDVNKKFDQILFQMSYIIGSFLIRWWCRWEALGINAFVMCRVIMMSENVHITFMSLLNNKVRIFESDPKERTFMLFSLLEGDFTYILMYALPSKI